MYNSVYATIFNRFLKLHYHFLFVNGAAVAVVEGDTHYSFHIFLRLYAANSGALHRTNLMPSVEKKLLLAFHKGVGLFLLALDYALRLKFVSTSRKTFDFKQ